MNHEGMARKITRERSGGACEGCDRDRATDWAHRWARSGQGIWCPTNGMDLCRRCHNWAHAYPVDAQVAGWIVVPESNEVPELLADNAAAVRYLAAIPVFTAYRGWVLLREDGSIVRLGDRPTTGRRRRTTERRGGLARRDLSRPG